MRLRKILLVLFVCVAGPAVAGPLDDGLDAAQKGDYATALRLWRPLADQGDAIAQNNLGVMYAKGQGVPQDYVQAVEWYRKAAEQAYATGQYNLGAMYDSGEGVPKDYARAMSWYRKAADQGEAQAENDLGVMYDEGKGVAQDYTQAHMWFNLAAANLPEKAGRDKAVSNRDRVAAKMTPAQITQAQKLAREWKPKPER